MLLLAVNMFAIHLALWPPNLGDGLQLLAMASNLTLPLLALFPKVFSLRPACGTAFTSVRVSIKVCVCVCGVLVRLLRGVRRDCWGEVWHGFEKFHGLAGG